jgi:hypothetical protein
MSALHLVLAATLAAQSPVDLPEWDPRLETHPITTSNPVAQDYFDKGLDLVLASYRDEALVAFRTAQQLDTACAMCYWGEALVLGPHVGRTMTAEEDSAAQEAMKKATLNAWRVSAHERAYINALDRRFGSPAVASRQARDSAYAMAMGEIVRAFPEDTDAAKLLAQAAQLASPAQVGRSRAPSGPKPLPRTEPTVGHRSRQCGSCRPESKPRL